MSYLFKILTKKFFLFFLAFISCAQIALAQKPEITSFSPTSAGANTSVMIKGRNLYHAIAVSFGGTPSDFFYNVDSFTIRAYVGNGSSGDISVTTDSGTATLSGFTFIPPPVIYSFTPTQGYAGIQVTIKGTGLSNAYEVDFGNMPAATFTVVSDSIVTAVVGSGASGNVYVYGPNGSGSLTGFNFIGPEITSFSPTSGGDGTLVTINGNHFLGTTAVNFGIVPAKSFSVVSETTITAVVAAGSAGLVAVTTNYGTAISEVGLNQPYIQTFDPFFGGPGTVVTIKGYNLINTTKVNFGDSTAKSFSILSDTIIQATLGYGASGDVVVRTPTDSAIRPYFYFAYPKPVVSSFLPKSGKFGSLITIQGHYFTGTTSVSFGGIKAQTFSVVSDSVIVATVGYGATGKIELNTPGGTVSADGFQYYAVPVITAFTPAFGPAGSQVKITGGNFNANLDSNFIFFSGVRAKVVAADSGRITVQVPYGAGYGAITLATRGYIASSPGAFQATFAGGLPAFADSSFEQRIDIPSVGTSPEFLAAGDFDGDGKIDLVVGDGFFGKKKSISVYKNITQDSKITFAKPIEYVISTDTLYNSLPVLTADIDADGKLDIIVTNITQNTVSILKNISTEGLILFAEKKDFTVDSRVGSEQVNPDNATIADFDGDGKPDLAFCHYGGIGSRGRVSILQNLSIGNEILFGAKQFYDVTNAWSVHSGDFNNDNKPDIAVAVDGYTGGVDTRQAYILGSASSPGQMSFQTIGLAGASGVFANSLAIADLDGDKKDDIAVMNNNTRTVSLLPNITTSFYTTFARTIEDTLDYHTKYAAINDIDGDSKPDLAVSNAINKVSIQKNKSIVGKIAFEEEQEYLTPNPSKQVLLVDLDNDGRPDIITANSEVDNPFISVFRNRIGEPHVEKAGEHPVTGNIHKKVIVDSAVISYNGGSFVQRHYDVEPDNNPETSTAKLTLQFTQPEFDNFNAYPDHGTDLPKNPTDASDKANIRIYQYHGTSTNGLPGTYSGNVIEINPADSSIKWNEDAECWEVTFDVTGFSGFFLSSEGNGVLPLKILSFTGSLLNHESALLKWQIAQDINTSFFNILRSTDGVHFSNVKQITNTAGNSNIIVSYDYQDNLEQLTSNIVYYKLMETDKNGEVFYSNIIQLFLARTPIQLKLYPNPAVQYVIIEHPASLFKTQLIVTDITGHVVKTISIGKGDEKTILNLRGLAAGAYNVKWIEYENFEVKNVLLLIEKHF